MSRQRLVGVASIVALVLVAAALVLALSAQRWFGPDAAAAGPRIGAGLGGVSTEALGAARQAAVNFTTYDYRNIQQDFARFAADTTGALHKQYTSFAPDLEAKFRDLQVRAVGQVVTAGIGNEQRCTNSGCHADVTNPNQVTVLVAVNNTIHNRQVPKGRVVYDRLAFVLKLVGNRWLASEVHEL